MNRSSVASSVAPMRMSGVWLLMVRAVWLLLVVPGLGLFVAGLPLYYQHLKTPCVDPPVCSLALVLTAPGLQALATRGVSASDYAAAVTLFWVIIVAIWSGVGFLIFWHRSDEWFVLLAAFALVMFNITFPELPTSALTLAYPALNVPIALLGVLGQFAITLFFLLFPNGRLVPRWTRLVIPMVIIQAVSLVVPHANAGQGWFDKLLSIAIYGTIIVVQVYRYRRVSTLFQRQQTKWVTFGIGAVATGFLVFGLLFSALSPATTQPDNPGSLLQLVYPLLLLLVPVSIGSAILRSHLWDIDILIKRTLIYGTLTACTVGLYILVVGYLGAVFRTHGNLAISLIATGLVALLFQPLRGLLQRAINRLLYGLRDEPYVVLARLSQRLTTTLDADTVLFTIVTTVREALKLSYAAIEVPDGGVSVLAAATGNPPANELLRLPLVHRGTPVGTLLAAARGANDVLAPADIQLLQDLANQIGTAVHTVRLTSDLRALTHDLQRSREQLITAREEERRRLRRDLHDGLGPMLSAILLKVGLVRTLHRRDPETTQVMLTQLENEIEAIIGDVRRVVYNLRPPALDELGLIGAIGEYATRLGSEAGATATGLRVTVDVPLPLPTLPAAVEVAAYRIVQEAVTNVIRHAHAQACRVLVRADDVLEIEVCDDGAGIAAADRSGVGLRSMQERADELGGTFTITKASPKGTKLTARLPLPTSSEIGAGS